MENRFMGWIGRFLLTLYTVTSIMLYQPFVGVPQLPFAVLRGYGSLSLLLSALVPMNISPVSLSSADQ
jgi:hypothetical protein